MTRIVFMVKRLSWCLTWGVFGLVAVAITLSSLGCSGPPLETWHTEKLTAEFTAEMADEIRTFDDYRQLEAKVFVQLKEEVYAGTESGPEYGLVRYSAGSAADPQRIEPNWNHSFEFPANTPVGGVLLLHGMSDSPYSLRALGEKLNQRDYPQGLRASAGRTWPWRRGWAWSILPPRWERGRSTSSAIPPGPPWL
jgi:hypothetical protein